MSETTTSSPRPRLGLPLLIGGAVVMVPLLLLGGGLLLVPIMMMNSLAGALGAGETYRVAVIRYQHETCTFCPGGDTDIPPAGQTYYYVVTGRNTIGEETRAGFRTDGSPRSVLTGSTCP